jgi:molybdopterin/thiamine biosynthesis adenylyltransferase
MLDDAAIERYSRQILLPEVGGRGQERLCAACVTVSGRDAGTAFAASLLAAAGVQVVCEDGSLGCLATRLGVVTVVGRTVGAAAVVATLVGRPCAVCVSETVWHMPAAERPVSLDAAQVVGALVAAETLRAALGLASVGRVQAFDLERGTFEARPLPTSDGCAACRVTA